MGENTVVIHQPDFLPYLGFFHRLLYADTYVVLDNVQFVNGSSRSWMNRDKIKTKQGEKWITVFTQKCPMNTNIKEVLIQENGDWRQKHLSLLSENYKKSPYFDEIFPYIQQLYNYKSQRLMDFNLESIKLLLQLFDINIDIIFASDLNVTGKNNELLVNILEQIGIKQYLSGVGARDYYKPEIFEEKQIKVIWQDFKHPVYPQLYGEFIPYLSSIDLLFNCGIEKSRKILRGEE